MSNHFIKLHFLLLCLLLISSHHLSLVNSTDPQKEEDANKISERLRNGLLFTEDIFRAANENNHLKSVKSLLSKIGKFTEGLTIIGDFFSLISNIFGGSGEDDKILNELSKIQQKLAYIDQKLDSMLEEIKDELIRNNYRLRWDQVKDLEALFKLLAEKQSPNSLENFLKGCDRHRMIDKLNYLDREMTGSTQGRSLISTMTRNFDRRHLTSESKMVVATFVLASTLNVACIGANAPYSNHTTVALREAAEMSTNILKKIDNSVSTEDLKIVNGFHATAKEDVVMTMGANNEMDNDQFANHLFKFLVHKYYWRKWFVASYSGGTRGFTQHLVSDKGKTGFHFFRYHGRSLLVATPSKGREIGSKFDRCLKFHPNYLDCRVLFGIVNKCMATSYDMLAIVRHGNGLKASYSLGGGIEFKNVGKYSFMMVA